MPSTARCCCRIRRELTPTTTPAEAIASAGVVVRDFSRRQGFSSADLALPCADRDLKKLPGAVGDFVKHNNEKIKNITDPSQKTY